MPKVSIIVPVYNVEKYLPECMESLLNQTLQDIEIILVDDGSPDNCPVLCDQYAKADARVCVIHKENGGLSSARNAGIQAASGDWIAFVDSDDLCEADMMERLLSAAAQHNAPLGICSTYYLNGGKRSAIDATRMQEEPELTGSHGILNNLWKSEYDNNLFTAPWNKLFNRVFFENVLQFREGIIYEDDDLCNRLYVNNYPVAVVHRPLYYWRMNPCSITHQTFSDRNIIFLSILQNRINMFQKIGNIRQAQKTAKVYCEIYIEYYFKAADQGHSEWVTKLRKEYHNTKKVCFPILTAKTMLRYLIFDLSPVVYRRITHM